MVDTTAARGYRPYLVVAGCPAYCAQGKWIVTYDGDGVARVHYVERVERLWKGESGPGSCCADGSRRRFTPETHDTNGQNPCLLYILGEPHPWYFESGWNTVGVMSHHVGRGDD